MSRPIQLCTFQVDDLVCGIEVDQIQEVMLSQRMTPVPIVSRVVAGLINLRGQIVTALDMRRRLDMADRPQGQICMNLVVRTSDGLVSLIVDDIGDVVDVDPAKLEDPPSTVRGVLKQLICHVYRTAQGLVLMLDVERTVDLEGELATGRSTA